MAWPETDATLEELLEEPIIRLLMRRDGVAEAEIRRLMARADRRPDDLRDGRPHGRRIDQSRPVNPKP